MEPSKNLFFSIIVPAHNEELYIEETLEYLARLSYPREKYEVIVIENGSADRTFEKAKRFANNTVSVVSVATKGVSKAKNYGIRHMSAAGDWVIFLDADTFLKPEFLTDLNSYLQKNSAKNYTVGTVSILPSPETFLARAWFMIYDLSHQITKTSYSIQIFKRSLFPAILFDEELTMGEDLRLLEAARYYGIFFYFKTKTVLTSTRRFVKEGWIKVLVHWSFVALLPVRLQRRFIYKVVR